MPRRVSIALPGEDFRKGASYGRLRNARVIGRRLLMAPVWLAPMARRPGFYTLWPAGAVEVARGNDHVKASPLERAAVA
jgi:hypothetical protein